MNPHWNVHRSLELLQGLQSSGLLLLQELDKYFEHRNDPKMIGTAAAVTVLVSYGVEIAIKTLHAQTRLNEMPPQGHNLLTLFDALERDAKEKAACKLRTLPAIGGSDWVGEDPDIRSIIEIGAKNFTEWRYLPERQGVGGGVPKGLINVLQALRAACLEYVTSKT